jgi:trigger factor
VDVEVGGSGFIPGFSEQIEGIRPGETRTIEVRFPDEYPAAEVAGKQASFEITAKVIKRPVAPEEGKDLAAILGFEGMDELRAVIRTQVQREYDQLSRLRLKRELLDTLDKRVAFATPEGMVETEFSQIWGRLQADREAGRLDEEDRSKDEETLRADYRVIAERRVRLGLLLAEIGRAHDISVGADEMTRAMRMEASRYPGHEAQLMEAFRKNPRAADSLRGPILEEKVVDFILGQAKVEDRIVSPEELARDPEDAPLGPAGSAPAAGVAPAESPTDEPADQQLVDQPSEDQPSADQPPADHPGTEI